jgi:glycosyltransferase involved in cell wall biosynthesis
MKICYLANAESIHTHRWVSYFAKKGHRVYLISFKPPKFNYENIEIFLIKKLKHAPGVTSHFVNFLPAFFQIKKILKRIDFDVLHAYGAGEGWLASLIGFYPLILTLAGPGILPDIPKSKIYDILNKYALKKADLITCDGENTKEAMINLGACYKKIKIIRFGVDTQKFNPQKIDDKFKQKLFGDKSKIVISLRHLKPEYSIETLIEAIPPILKEVPEARFIIGGEEEQKEYLVNLAESLNILDAIKFVGWISNENLPLYLNSADVYVSTSLLDSGLSASTAEAMACGLPVVISDSGDNKIWIKDGENGFIFPLGDSKSLAEKVIYLLRNENFKLKAGAISRKIIEEKNNYYKEMERMEKNYKELINEK